MSAARVQCEGDFVEVYSGKGKQFKFSHKFDPGSHAHFRVRARNAIGWSEHSEEMEFRAGAAPPSPPHPPTLTHCTVHSLTLHWTPPPDSGAPVTSFCLEMDDPNTVSGGREVGEGRRGQKVSCKLLLPAGLWVLPSVPGRRPLLHLPGAAESYLL